MLDLHRLRLLQEFAARGSIARTAAVLGYTPSAVSQQLAALEREAGTALLDRSARRAELTDAGRPGGGHGVRLRGRRVRARARAQPTRPSRADAGAAADPGPRRAAPGALGRGGCRDRGRLD